MHAARHRALRELGALCRQLADHWEALAGRAGRPAAAPLREGARAGREVLAEVRAHARERDLEIGPAALNAGRLVRARAPVADGLLERNQAVRLAVLDAQHVATLAEYLAELAARDGDEPSRAACDAWARRLGDAAEALRAAAVGLGARPDAAIEPLGPGQRLGYAIGWLGEATDRLGRRRRR